MVQGRRPCGPSDRRRVIRRCEDCRRLRKSCDGQNPCGRCQKRGAQCQGPVQHMCNDLMIVQAVPPRNSLDTYRDEAHLSPSCISEFYAFIGQVSSPFTLALSPPVLARYLASVPAIRAVISAIVTAAQGKRTSMAHHGILLETDSKDAAHVTSALNRHLGYFLSERNSDRFTALLFGVLMIIFQTTVDESGLGFISTTEALSIFCRQRFPSTSPPRPEEQELYNTQLIIESYRGFTMNECPLIGWPGDAEILMRCDGEQGLLHKLAAFLPAVAQANAMSVEWTKRARGLSAELMPENPNSGEGMPGVGEPGSDLFQLGTATIEQGWIALKMMEGIKSHELSGAAELAHLRDIFYRIALVSISRLYDDKTWSLFNQTLPAQDVREELAIHALSSLESIEYRLAFVGLEALFYLPLLTVIALESFEEESRGRVEAVLKQIADKGFVVAKTYLTDIHVIWDYRPE